MTTAPGISIHLLRFALETGAWFDASLGNPDSLSSLILPDMHSAFTKVTLITSL